MGKTVRLRHSSVLFCDPETGFEISGDEAAPFPRKVGSLTRAWLQGGGLLVEESVEGDSLNDESVTPVPNPKRIYSDQEISEMSYDELVNVVRDSGIRTWKNSKKREHLIEALIEYQDTLKTSN